MGLGVSLAMRKEKLKREKVHRFFEQYGNTMFRAALEVTHDYHDAEDALQQCCIALFNVIDGIDMDNPSNCAAYAAIMAERKALDILRRRKQQNEISYEDAEEAGFAIEYTGDDPLSGVMAELPPRYREVLLLRYGIGNDIAETARTLNISVAACYKLISRAKARLRKVVEQRKELEKNGH